MDDHSLHHPATTLLTPSPRSYLPHSSSPSAASSSAPSHQFPTRTSHVHVIVVECREYSPITLHTSIYSTTYTINHHHSYSRSVRLVRVYQCTSTYAHIASRHATYLDSRTPAVQSNLKLVQSD